jgi:hypothetical protein
MSAPEEEGADTRRYLGACLVYGTTPLLPVVEVLEGRATQPLTLREAVRRR